MMNAIFPGRGIYLDILNFVVELLLILYFFQPLENRRGRARRAAGVAVLLLLAYLYFRGYLGLPEITQIIAPWAAESRLLDLFLRHVYYALPVFGYLCLTKKTRLVQALYLMLYYLFFYETSYIYRHTIRYLANMVPFMRMWEALPAAIGFICVLLIEVYFVWWVRRTVPLERIEVVRPFRMIFVFGLNLLSLYLKYSMMIQQGAVAGLVSWDAVLYPILAGLSMEFIMVFFESHQALEEERKALQLQKELRAHELVTAQKAEEANQNVRRIYHDMKNHLLAIRTMEGESGRVSAYIDTILEELNPYEELVRTGLPYLDAYLSQKTAALKAMGVQCHIALSLGQLAYIAPVDMISVVGNCVDNAEEALRRLPAEQRTLILKSSSYANMVLLQAVNSFDGQLRWQNGRLVTQKKNAEMHGVGLRTIQRVAEKYGGSVNIEADADKKQFRLTVMLPEQN